jgi:uncharacterized membrane protein
MRYFRIVPNWLRLFILVVLIFGVFFRFTNLSTKVFWHDETYTMLRVSGYTAREVKQKVFNGSIISPLSLAKFQNINAEKNLGDTIHSLAIEDPQHPPLYYIIARFWVQIFGNSVTAIRSLSAVISLMVFPCTYWLCWELFKVPLGVGGIAIALISSSPLHFAYAQEAREYILWIVTILLSSAALLRAIRLESESKYVEFPVFNWGLYAITLSLSLYTFLLSGFVATAHVIYVMAIHKFRWNKTVEAFLTAILVAFLFFSPWLVILIQNFYQFNNTTAWTATPLPIGTLIQLWLLQITRIFIDFSALENIGYLIGICFLGLVSYAIYFLYITTHIKVWLFIVLLIFIPALPLILPDLIFGGMRSISERYLLPSYIGIQLAIAYLLAYQLNNGLFSRRRIWQILTVTLLSFGLISITVSSQAETWWNKVISYGNPQVARIINQASRPLLISDDTGINYGNVFSLSYLLEPKVRLQLVREKSAIKIDNKYTNIFVLNPPKNVLKNLEEKYKLKANIAYLDKYYTLFKLEESKNSLKRS